ncbi:hypothetical protein HA402_007914 [Bradysia odoriphaga]|nr:hypothetical protein HA402_007914 [Bradysia odoriphaga]
MNYMQKPVKLNGEMTVEDLKEKIAKEFKIIAGNQEVYFDNERIDLRPDVKLSSFGSFDELTLKHVNLPNWDSFMKIKKDAEQGKKQKLIKDAVKLAIQQLEAFKNNEFFLCYPKLAEMASEFNQKFAHFLDTDIEYLECAVQFYFKDLHPNCTISFEQKTKGASIGTICLVNDGKMLLAKYFVKSHYNLHRSSAVHHAEVDLRELFIYKLLEFIRVGPKVHFVGNTHKSKYGLFIATEAVKDFKEKSNLKLEHKPDFDTQLQLLRHIFNLNDLISNTSNYGADGDGNLMIIDFKVSSHSRGLKTFLNSNKSKYSDFRRILDGWNISHAVKMADSKIGNEKQLIKEKELSYKSTRDYQLYLQQVEENIQSIVSKIF